MPVIRCSNEVYTLLQQVALRDNEPVAIVLDRIGFSWARESTREEPTTKNPAPVKARPKSEIHPKKARPPTQRDNKPDPEIEAHSREPAQKGKRKRCQRCGASLNPSTGGKEAHKAVCRANWLDDGLRKMGRM